MQTESLKNKDVSLLDILDAVLEKGVVLRGDITISIADIDLVYLDLRILLSSVETLMEARKKPGVMEMEQKIKEAERGVAGYGTETDTVSE
ncbi:gas vesicle protein GvpS [Salipaludibacillus neizhouensis]|uniref:Gas vesicle protein GvpS n=1 Tax=Salipaludibacillus neizhouensis TaxID=885475 RepID=A0A3A9KFC8_9BACI|nr:gas vesicle protein [Salipaludibacillus neizhouensis]RKL66295.1 gas vesicle protein GvpS [Salipaludibacillus neizhouensis]